MALARRSPFGMLSDFNRMMENMFQEAGNGEEETALSRWTPRTDIYEEGDDIVLELEIPGTTKEDLNVSVENNRLTIRGERREEKTVEEEERNYYRSERIYGQFQRSFSLPQDVDAEQIHAEYDEGVLTVRVPKTETSRKHSIQIN